ncbi:enterochelin esterase [Klebsiella sp. BIGb0407]|uniref:enterochelin esterase n=1 Tax=Klebsiella sp. BIGb0407 TaxID=2940603 RepID=UPI002168C48D|nr:enterochelin esterase [Klebsiella sp. BIGb0407]MCS3434364.1 enterochelin esterase family protein [Klebsiella sp. BIGb0407]
MVLQPDGTVSAWLAESAAGSESWWQKVAVTGTPVAEKLPDDGRLKLTFLWRDEQGNELTSPIERVYLDINGVTDHHSFSPASLERLPGTNIWTATVDISDDWRGSYSLIPVNKSQLPTPSEAAPEQQRRQQREWWCSLFPATIADPLNPNRPHGNSRGMRLSAIHLPAALSQQAWHQVDSGTCRSIDDNDYLLEWQSPRLGNRRRTWLWQPAGSEGQILPLVILLDGQNWVKNMSLLPMLEEQSRRGELPAAVWLMIDAIDDETRSRELPCNADFWLAVQEELLPLAQSHTLFTDSPVRTIVAGQSYGGLASLYAGLHWPQRFGCVLTQSGSFWWPNMKFMTHYEQREEHEPGFLTQQVALCSEAAPLRIFQEAGLFEEDIHFVNQQMNQELLAVGHQVNYRSYQGGHDVLCWRGGLVDGVRWLLTER